MLVYALAEKRDVRGQRHVATHFLPCKLETIVGGPHILAAARYRVASFRRVVFHGAFVKDRSDVAVAFENAHRQCDDSCANLIRARAASRREYQYENASHRRRPNGFLSAHGEILHPANEGKR